MWWHDALCQQVGLYPFYAYDEDDDGSPDPATARAAIEVCHRCPVIAECLADAMREEAHDVCNRHGIRGGLSAHQRRELGKRHAVA